MASLVKNAIETLKQVITEQRQYDSNWEQTDLVKGVIKDLRDSQTCNSKIFRRFKILRGIGIGIGMSVVRGRYEDDGHGNRKWLDDGSIKITIHADGQAYNFTNYKEAWQFLKAYTLPGLSPTQAAQCNIAQIRKEHGQ